MTGKDWAVPTHGRLLADARIKSEKSPASLARAFGVVESTWRNAERGRYGRKIFENETMLRRHFGAEAATELVEAFRTFVQTSVPEQADHFKREDILIPVELLHGLAEARITRFHPSRHYYSLLREGRSTISAYVSQAATSLEMVSITLATGVELEKVVDSFGEMILRREPVTIWISLLNPGKPHLMQSIADVLGTSQSSLEGRINDTIRSLTDFRRETLPRSRRRHFRLSLHNSLPNASAIILDGDQENGLVQLETKGYKMGLNKSFGFEVAHGSEFFSDLRDSYRHLMADGDKILWEE